MSKAKSTPLGRVRNHGAAAEGTGHFVGQRVSAIALIFLATWFVLSAALTMDGPTYVAAIDFLSQPFNAVGVILLVMVSLYHMRIGMGEVINDYIARPATKVVLLLMNVLLPLVIAAGALFAVLLVNFGV